MRETSLPQANSGAGAAIAYNLAGIAVIVLLLAVGAAYLVDRLSHEGDAPTPLLGDGDVVTQTISGRELTIPRTWFRFGEQLRDGFTSQIDLSVMIDIGENAASQPVNVTLMPRSRARTSASLLDAVYLHQFRDETADGVPGLVGKPMAASNGYRDETVWYDAISPNPFVAKCLATVPGTTPQCVRTVYLPSGIAAVYSFDATLLDTWRDFDRQMEQWLTPIGAWSP
jgi:uncharacterized membrane protein YuzA (DUF378 family)